MAEATTTEDKPKRRRSPRKAKAEKPARSSGRGRKSKSGDSFDCRFGKLSVGEHDVGIGITIPRHQISLTRANELFCKRRLSCRITLQPNGDDPDQTYLFDGSRTDLATIVDVNYFSVKPEVLSCRLLFALDDLKNDDVLMLAKKEGRIAVDSVSEVDGDDD